MARTTLATLITRLRLLIGDPAGAEQQFSDDELQELLDEERTDAALLALTPVPTAVSGSLVTLTFEAPYHPWEAGVQLVDASLAALTPETEDLGRGRWTFAEAPSQPVRATGAVYDIYAAAARACEVWAAALAREYDFSSNEQSWKRSQQAAALADQARRYRSLAAARAVPCVREDVAIW